MGTRRSVAAVCAAVLIVTAAFSRASAQDADDIEAWTARLEAAQIAAQEGAVRPGDEALDCTALQAEFEATFSSPEMQAYYAAMAVSAQASQEMMERAESQRGQAGVSMVLGLASAFVPGLGYAQQLMQMGQIGRQQAMGEEHMAAMMGTLAPMEAALPQMMRGQRLMELADAQNCTFINEPDNLEAFEGGELEE